MKIIDRFLGYFGAVALVIIASLLCETVRLLLAPTNMVMIYLLAVVFAAAKIGLRPAILTAFLSVLAFDFLFIPPRFSFRVSDTEYLVTFFALFVVGVVISSLVVQIREKMEEVKQQELRTSSLYYLTRDLTAAYNVETVVDALKNAVLKNFGSRISVALVNEYKVIMILGTLELQFDESSQDVVDWVIQSGRRAGNGTSAFSDSRFLFFPIKSGVEVIGVMIIEKGGISLFDTFQLIEAFAGQVAMAFERVQLVVQAGEARILREKNQLEQALLNSISHDLRTPLVTISGVIDLLLNEQEILSKEKRQKLLIIASEEAGRLNRFVGSLLDMTRIEAGVIKPNFVDCDIDEIIGCAIGAIEQRIGNHRILTHLESELPFIRVDLALLTQAFVNLLDNAIKHSPDNADVTLSARLEDNYIIISVIDIGTGIPTGEEERIFEKFYQITVPEKTGGTGLGLSIAKGVVEAHNGKIKASNRSPSGLIVEVMLPCKMQV